MKNKSLDLSHTYVTKVQRVDPLGQGVCFLEGEIVFVPKTLENEVVKISIESQKKGVYFGKLLEVEVVSDKRIHSECTHFYECRGCDYLHLNYENELEYKYQSLLNNFKAFPTRFNIRTHKSISRFHYRNRIQLHYSLLDRNKPQLGLFSDHHEKKSILPVPKCLLPTKSLAAFMNDFYDQWHKQIPPQEPRSGHVEIYEHLENISVAWNKSYSHLGFSQVNDNSNQILRSLVLEQLSEDENNKKDEILLELFCGFGNLLKNYQGPHTILGVDIEGAMPKPHQFKKLDLYSKKGFLDLIESLGTKKIASIVLDPPRSGFRELSNIISDKKPKTLIYISCWIPTLIRDLKDIYAKTPWNSMTIDLIDMFPGTKHYETLVSIHW